MKLLDSEQLIKIKRFSLWMSIAWTVLVLGIVIQGAAWRLNTAPKMAREVGLEYLVREENSLLELTHNLSSADMPQLGTEAITSGTSPHSKTISDNLSMEFLVHSLMNKLLDHDHIILNALDSPAMDEPDKEWLQRARDAFMEDSGVKNYFEEIDDENGTSVKIVSSLRAKAECLHCHAEKGVKQGDLFGVLSLSIPLKPFQDYLQDGNQKWGMSIIFLWLIGLGGAWYFRKYAAAKIFDVQKISRKYDHQGRIIDAQNKFFEHLYDSISDIVVIVDKDRFVINANKAFFELSGYRPEDVIGEKTHFLFPSRRGHLQVRKLFEKQFVDADNDQMTFETECRKKDETIVPCELTISKFVSPVEGQMGHVVVVRDITQRKKDQYRDEMISKTKDIILKIHEYLDLETPELFRMGLHKCACMTTSKIAVAFFDEDFAAPMMTSVMSLDAEEMLKLGESNSADDSSQNTDYPEYFLQWTGPSIIEDIPEELNRVIKTASGTHINRCIIVPWIDKQNHCSTVVIANKKDPYDLIELQQVSVLVENLFKVAKQKIEEKEKQQLEKTIQEAQKMEAVGVLAGGVAHDLNNILGIVFCNMDLALDQIKTDITAERYLSRVVEMANRAKEIVDQLLTFARKDSNELSQLYPSKIIDNCVNLLQSTIPKTVTVLQSKLNKPYLILANQTQFEQVLINLFYNAVHALENENGTVIVTEEIVDLDQEDVVQYESILPGPFFKMSVCDTGVGIAYDSWREIFNPFYTTKKNGKGTGLGLSVAKGIAQSHGGMLQFESEVGRGSSFHAFFPVYKLEETKPLSPETSWKRKERGSGTILVVDDDDIYLEAMSIILEQSGYSVSVGKNGEEAFEIFKKDPYVYDLVITDQVMPVMVGTELVEHIRAIRTDLPFILCTGFQNNLSDEEIFNLGIQAICKKPFNREGLLEYVEGALARDKTIAGAIN